MPNIVSEWAESHFPLYTADNFHSLYSTSSMPLHKFEADAKAFYFNDPLSMEYQLSFFIKNFLGK
ncbi:hypothetical protein [Paenibacillus aceris]|uniref:Uncharacterized protein n=1 Tax=Paenibacillus aceris TaxID=869555 RepID=A0ABS4HTC3_9BACL|nr:hypothetical protein [Paenibacillus aceris]MBP1961857.1 hypothetical protein [Paenibacillus aceris]NHW34288.1 hypothetical protein [Paenibacillus aceris]